MSFSMFFSWAARIVAVILLAHAVMKFSLSVYVSSISNAQDQAQAVTKFLGSGTVRDHLDRATYALLLALALGTLAEISFHLRALLNK